MASGFQKIDYLDLPLVGVKVNTFTDSSSLWPANCSWARFTNHSEDAPLAWQEKEEFPSSRPNHMGFGAEIQYSDDFLQRSSFWHLSYQLFHTSAGQTNVTVSLASLLGYGDVWYWLHSFNSGVLGQNWNIVLPP